MAANSTEGQFLSLTATGGQTHARISRGCQMSPDKSQSKAPKRQRSPLACFFFSSFLPDNVTALYSFSNLQLNSHFTADCSAFSDWLKSEEENSFSRSS